MLRHPVSKRGTCLMGALPVFSTQPGLEDTDKERASLGEILAG